VFDLNFGNFKRRKLRRCGQAGKDKEQSA